MIFYVSVSASLPEYYFPDCALIAISVFLHTEPDGVDR